MTRDKFIGWGIVLVFICAVLYVLFYPPAPTAVKATNRAVKTAVNVVTEQKEEIKQHKIETKTKVVTVREYIKKDVEKLPPDALVAGVRAELELFRRTPADKANPRP